jgi:hypothetical protein
MDNRYCVIGDKYVIKLADLGFHEGYIGETIVSTFDLNGQPNAAPMGVVIECNEKLKIKPYLTSLTYNNLQAKRCAVINVTSNPTLFYMTAFKDIRNKRRIPTVTFKKAEAIDAPRLGAADAIIEVLVAKTNMLCSKRAEILCNVQLVKSLKKLPKVYCRAQFATIEAIIHATRIEPLMRGNKQEQKQAVYLLELIDVCEDVVNRTAPNSIYSEIMTDLTQRIGKWRN